MKYRKEVNDFEKALYLDKSQVTRLKNAINKAWNQEYRPDGSFNIDEINAFVAPYIKTMEEAFYVAHVIGTSIYGSVISLMQEKN